MIKTIWFWLENSRFFSIPMALFSWFVVFTYALTNGGNALYGFLALIGIVLGQLATNLLDDCLDYKILKQKGLLQSNTKSKCRYITDGNATLKQAFGVVAVYLTIASIIGLILTVLTGYQVIIFALLGGFFILLYSKLSITGLSELAVGITFGPILFGGVYWVMTQSLDYKVFILSVIVVMFTIGLLYTHTLLDFDGDMQANKKTLCCRIKNKNIATNLILFIFGLSYLLIAIFCTLKILPMIYYITYFTIPMALDLFLSLKLYVEDKNYVPQYKFWHFPMENIQKLKEQGVESFMFRLYQARNLMIYFSILICIAIVMAKLNH